MFKGVSGIDFASQFQTNEDCYKYLMELKWNNSYSCVRCGCTEHHKGRTYYYRRCKACAYDESVTANTIFHGIRMPIIKAFYMAFRLTAKVKGMSTVELAAEVDVQQKTAWLFKRKIQAAMQRDKQDKLTGTVEVDETLVGGYSTAKGRSTETKQPTLVAVEILPDGRTGNIALRPIENFTADEIKYALKEIVSDEAKMKTDAFASYEKLSKEMNIEMHYSNSGLNMLELHKQIMQFKNWLRGIHHKCAKQYLFAYIAEYEYRFNHRNMREYLFNDILKRIINQIPHPKKYLKSLCVYST